MTIDLLSKLMKKTFIALLSFTYSISVKAQPSFIKDSLDSYIKEGMKDWSIPALAITIVHDGNIITMKGYGLPVTFGIISPAVKKQLLQYP